MPARYREVLTEMGVGRMTLTVSPAGCLVLYPEPTWLVFRQKLMELPMGASAWRSVFLGNAAEVDCDASARILIPPELRHAAKLTKDVAMRGVGNHIELWDAQVVALRDAALFATEMPSFLSDMVF